MNQSRNKLKGKASRLYLLLLQNKQHIILAQFDVKISSCVTEMCYGCVQKPIKFNKTPLEPRQEVVSLNAEPPE